MGANVNPAGPSAPRPAAKRRLDTGTVSVEFLRGGDVGPVNLDLHLHVLSILLLFFRRTGVPDESSAPKPRLARSAAELLALYGPGAPKRRRVTGTVSFGFLPVGGGGVTM